MATSAGGGVGNVVSYKSAADLSSYQYRFVTLSAANTVNLSGGTNEMPEGVLINKPASTSAASDVQIDGIAKLSMNGTCAYGNVLCSGTDGRGLLADATGDVHVRAKALEAASAAGDIISVRLINQLGTTAGL